MGVPCVSFHSPHLCITSQLSGFIHIWVARVFNLYNLHVFQRVLFPINLSYSSSIAESLIGLCQCMYYRNEA